MAVDLAGNIMVVALTGSITVVALAGHTLTERVAYDIDSNLVLGRQVFFQRLGGLSA